jgi:beta-galactosidase GanA
MPSLINAMKDAGVQAVRLPIRWITIEPERGKWDFTKVDRIVRALRDARIDLLRWVNPLSTRAAFSRKFMAIFCCSRWRDILTTQRWRELRKQGNKSKHSVNPRRHHPVTSPLPLPYPSRPTPEVEIEPPVWVWRGMGGVWEGNSVATGW